MNLRQLKLNNKGILFFLASLSIVVIVTAVVNMYHTQVKNDIKSFRVTYLNEDKEIYSNDPKYCKFLEMYFDSFTVDTVHSGVDYDKENLLETYPIKVEVFCANNIEYVVYLDLLDKNDLDQYDEGFFKREPALWVINNVEDNIFIMPGKHSSKLALVFKEMYE